MKNETELNHAKMLHILDCTNEELLTFEILKNYKGHIIRIKPIFDKPHIKLYKFGDDKMYINNDIDVKRELHVLFQMFNGFEVDLGIVVQELVYDKENFEYFINERLKYIGSFLNAR